MYFLLGNSHMERGDYEGAIQSFEHARAQMRHYGGRPLLVVSWVSFLMMYCNVSKSLTDSDRYPDGNLIISTSRFDNVSVKVCMQRVARKMQANFFSIW